MWSGYLVLTVLRMSLVASIVILAVIFIRELMKKAPKICSYLLWSVVLFRLLCPISITTPFSILPAEPVCSVKLEQADANGTEELHMTNGTDTAISSGTDVSDGTNLSSGADVSGGMEAVLESDIFPDSDMVLGLDESGFDGVDAAFDSDASVLFQIGDVTIRFSYLAICVVTAVWLMGIAALLLYNIICFIRLKKKLREAIPLEQKGRQTIYLSDQITTPFCMGFFRTEIYLPCYLSEKEQSYIILHEQTHLKRGDHIVKLIAFLALAIHWFNPLVWIAFRLAGQDMEMSCDESVLWKIDRDIRADYSASLLKLAIGHHVISGTPLGFGEGDTKVRVKNVMNYKKPVVGVLIGVGLIALICMILLGTNGKWNGFVTGQENPKEDENTQEDTEDGNQTESVEVVPPTELPQGNSTKAVLYSDVEEWFDQECSIFPKQDAPFRYILYCSSPAAGMMSKYLFLEENGVISEQGLDVTGAIPNYPKDMIFFTKTTGYILTDYHGSEQYLFRTSDGGNTWSPVTIEVPDVEDLSYVEGVHFVPGENPDTEAKLILRGVGGEEDRFYQFHTSDAGNTWELDTDEWNFDRN